MPVQLPNEKIEGKGFPVREIEEDEELDGLATRMFFFLILLPFNMSWKILVHITVCITVAHTLHKIFFTDFTSTFLDGVPYYAMEGIYFVDTVVSYMHRYITRLRKFTLFPPRNLALMTINTISLLPIYEFYLLIMPAIAEKIRFYVRTKCLLRLIHFVHSICKTINFSIGMYIYVVLMSLITFYVIIGMIGAIIWQYMSCFPHCKGKLNWSEVVSKLDIKPTEKFQWFVLCFNTMSSVLMNRWPGAIQSDTNRETILMIIMMMTGFVVYVLIANGHITKILLQTLDQAFNYMQLGARLNWMLTDWDISQNLREKITDFYTILWRKRNGMIMKPQFMHLLPISLTKEIYTDIFWEALRHSHIFRDIDMSLKRQLALVMKAEFLLPGDYLLRAGMQKNKLYYLAHGVIQLLSIEDDSSPILSFSSGTVFGEITCFNNFDCGSNLRCATDCEVHSLYMKDTVRIFLAHKKQSLRIRHIINARIENAKEMKNAVVLQKKADLLGYTPTNSIKRFKKQWRYVDEMDKRSKRRRKKAESFLPTMARMYDSKYLDLFVISNKIELQVTTICIHSDCPCVIDPNSSLRMTAHYVHLIAVVLQIMITPYYVVYSNSYSMKLYLLAIILDMIYIFDVYLQTITAIKTENNVTITDFAQIALYRLTSLTYIIDVLATIPYDYFASMFNTTENKLNLLRLPKILKCYRLFSFVMILQKKRTGNLAIIFVKYLVIFSVTFYLAVSVLFAVTCWGSDCIPEDPDHLLASSYTYVQDNLTVAVSFTMSMLLGNGFANNTPVSNFSMIIYYFYSLFGLVVYLFLICEVTANVIKLNEDAYQYRDHLKVIHNFIMNNSLPNYFKEVALNFYTFGWFYNKNYEVSPRKQLGETSTLENEIVQERIADALINIQLFKDLDDMFRWHMAAFGTIRVLPSGTYVIEENEKSLHMYVILRGYCRMHCLMPGDKEKNTFVNLTVGACFPILEVLHNVTCLNTVVTVTAVELVSIAILDVMNLLKAHRDKSIEIERALRWHLQKYYNIIIRKVEKKRVKIYTGKLLTKGDMFRYKISEKDDNRKYAIGINLGSIRYFLLRKTICPHSKFYMIWETVHSILVIVYFILVQLKMTLLYDYRNITSVIITTIQALLYSDLYIRLHIQYYTEDSILITDPITTAKNYVKIPILLDIFKLMPWDKALAFASTLDTNSLHIFLQMVCVVSLFFRPMSGLKYLESKKGLLQYYGFFGRRLLGFVAVGLICTNVILFGCCKFDGAYHCNNTFNIISGSHHFKNASSHHELFIVSLYSVTTRFSGAFIGMTNFELCGNLVESLMLIIFLWLSKILVVSYMTGAAIGGNVLVIKYRNRMTNFLAFIDKEMVSEQDIDTVVEYYEYLWKKTEGISLERLLSAFYEKLNLDIKCYMFKQILQDSFLFSGEPVTTTYMFINYMVIQYIIKGGTIIQCNDIQSDLFFVAKGEVNIYMAGFKLQTLTRGGVFGSLSRKGSTRQTITARARVHVELLVIDCALFRQLIKPYPILMARVHNAALLGYEYIPATLSSVQSGLFSRHGRLERSSAYKYSCFNCYRRFNNLIQIGSQSYKMYMCVLQMHISPISCILLIAIEFFDIKILYLQIYCYTIDTIFWANIIIQFHLYYIDPETGVTINQPSLIRARYARSLSFWIDIIGTLPNSLIGWWLGLNDIYVRLLALNRLIRFGHLLVFYEVSKRRLNLSTSLQLAYISYVIMFLLSIFAFLWYIVTCPYGYCYMHKVRVDDIKYTAMSRSFLHATNLFTTSNLRTVQPFTYADLFISMIITMVSVFMVAFIGGAYTSLLVINGVTHNSYKSKMNNLRTYSQDRCLSPILIKKIDSYMTALWVKRRGELIPRFISVAPPYLKQKIMGILYGHYLRNHFMFNMTHIDFLRQVVVLFKLHLYLAGQVIVEKGDMDESMYFIHRGEVKVDVQEGPKEIMGPGSSFGELQGLYNIPHDKTYIAHITSDILILTRSDWLPLLHWFPASREVISKQLPFVRPVNSEDSLTTSVNERFSLSTGLNSLY